MVQVAEALQNAGAAAVTIHGRTMEQRYKRAADWGLVQQAATHLTVPVIGNGDVLTYYEVKHTRFHTCSSSVLGGHTGCHIEACCTLSAGQELVIVTHGISYWCSYTFSNRSKDVQVLDMDTDRFTRQDCMS